jgi:hypothetical protein
VAELEDAANLYPGDFLEGLSIESDEFESWRREESTRCKFQRSRSAALPGSQVASLP